MEVILIINAKFGKPIIIILGVSYYQLGEHFLFYLQNHHTQESSRNTDQIGNNHIIILHQISTGPTTIQFMLINSNQLDMDSHNHK